MSRKESGLGRGLGDLLIDNAPEVRHSGTVIRRDEEGDVSISPTEGANTEIIHAVNDEYRGPQVHTVITPITVKYDEEGEITDTDTVVSEEPRREGEGTSERPRTSLKAVFRNYK